MATAYWLLHDEFLDILNEWKFDEIVYKYLFLHFSIVIYS